MYFVPYIFAQPVIHDKLSYRASMGTNDINLKLQEH